MNIKHSKKLYWGILILAVLAGSAAVYKGLAPKMQTGPLPQAVDVKAMQVVKQDTAQSYKFVGEVQSKNEVAIISKVAGNIVAKMVKGGDIVYKGQPLFRIDDKQYKSAILSARASLNQAEATLNNVRKDVDRYQQLAAIQGVSQQTLDAEMAQEEEDAASVETYRANLQQAEENEADTLICSPVDGRMDVNDLSIGAYAAAGSTTLATVSSLDPIWVQFSMSENEYLDLLQQGNGALPASFRDNLKLTLSNGAAYPLQGHIEQIDKGISDTTGTITLKASFDNPQKMLLPGMFAQITAQGPMLKDALLVPQKAVKQILDDTFVTVVTAENKAESRPVKLGDKIGTAWVVVTAGLNAGDRVVVEGIDKAKQGTVLNVTIINPDDLQTPAKQ
ncbi:rnd efflux pump membrane fusion protein barrel-sandwich domain [Lucifera butyrica]|uniref:Rnd efflux pump membrane fusion protein barrel-sandwich domain n=1 Tax=Lucifera butyrica TaxID=1351585 RepID=A0A498RBQ6_9FIRM|nr:efflux RND transporter periplasmic adaptor subunit [Lucifera butyrica]VBB08934.1 rnd efflux pump membrane fusion protein barrel-sandwich domain [Lucifera butyrica]